MRQIGLALGLVFVIQPALRANINLELRGMPASVCAGQVVNLGLYAVSDDAGNQSMGGAEVLLVWDAAQLKLVGHVDNGPYAWLGSFFPNDSQGDGLNAPFTGPNPFVPENDGDAIYSVFSQFTPNPPAEATPAGLLITTLQFRAVGPGVGTITVPASYAANSQTRIVDGEEAGVIVTGALPSTSVDVDTAGPPIAVVEGPRRFHVTPIQAGGCPTLTGIRVIGDALNPDISCVDFYVQADGTLGVVPFLQSPAAWGTVHVRGSAIFPGSYYEVYEDSGTPMAQGLLTPDTLVTWEFGDVDHTGIVDVDDITAILAGFSGMFPPDGPNGLDLMPCTANGLIDVDDVLGVLSAFQGTPFSMICAPPCP